MKLLVTLGAYLFSGFLCASSLHNIVVFGDSLSDNGNLYEYLKHQYPPSPPYYQGRFSNGPVWVERVIANYYPGNPEEHLLDYAVGGSGVSAEEEEVLFTFKKQVDSYFLSHADKANANDLYVVWIGANNYLGLPEDKQQALEEVNAGIINGVELLIKKGARHVLLFNIPDLGKTPAAKAFDIAEELNDFSLRHNQMLAHSFSELKQRHPEVDWMYYDIFSLFTEAVSYPSRFGFTNVTDKCSSSIVNESSKKSLLTMVAQVRARSRADACDGYLFFDLVHPTSMAHALIAEKVLKLFDDLGVVFADD